MMCDHCRTQNMIREALFEQGYPGRRMIFVSRSQNRIKLKKVSLIENV